MARTNKKQAPRSPAPKPLRAEIRPSAGIAGMPPSAPMPPAAPMPGMVSQILTQGAGVALGHVVAHHIIGDSKPTAGQANPVSQARPCGPMIEAFLDCAKKQNGYECFTEIEKLRECYYGV